MSFFVVFVALIIERFFDWGHVRQFAWYRNYEAYILRRLTSFNIYLKLAILIVPLALAVCLLQVLFANVLYGVLGFVFSVVVVLYCFGPRNLWLDSFASLTMLQTDESEHIVNDKVTIPLTARLAKQIQQQTPFLDTIFIEAEERVFAILFWFLLLGPLGAVLYRSLTLTDTSIEIVKKILFILDWVPVRILCGLFALAGQFMNVVNVIRRSGFGTSVSNELFLVECGHAALGLDKKMSADFSEVAVEKQAIHLIDRALVITLIIIAIGAFIF